MYDFASEEEKNMRADTSSYIPTTSKINATMPYHIILSIAVYMWKEQVLYCRRYILYHM